MASFVTEVLASSGKLEKEDLAGKINKMSRKVADAKVKKRSICCCGICRTKFDLALALSANSDGSET